MELSLSMLRAVVCTEIIIYVYAGIRSAIGKGNIEFEITDEMYEAMSAFQYGMAL